MENYSIEQFKADVLADATALKQHATAGELAKLNAALLDPYHYRQCIYGQMTGDCYSPRAARLIFDCCPRYIDVKKRVTSGTVLTLDDVVKAPRSEQMTESLGELEDYRDGIGGFHSAIENYLWCQDANISGLIAFLKGEADTVEL